MSEMAGTDIIFRNAEITRKLADYLNRREDKRCILKGLYGSSKGYVMSSSLATSSIGGIHIVIEDNKEAAEYFCADMYNILGADDVYFFPTSEAKVSRISTIKDSSQKVQRSSAISAINSELVGLPFPVLTVYPNSASIVSILPLLHATSIA